MKRVRTSLLASVCLRAGFPARFAQTWPSGPIRWLVGFPPGGTADMISRDIASHLEKVLGQPIVIENRPGANGSTATVALTQAKPDGQTLMMILSGHITNAFLYPNLGFDPLKDVTPVSLVASSPLAIVANPNFGPSDIKSLVAAAKEKPGTISYGNAGRRLDPAAFARTDGVHDRHEIRARAVSRRRAGAQRCDRRACAARGAERAAGDAERRGEAAQAARRHLERPHRCVARRSVHRGVRRAGLRGGAVVRRDRAEGHAGARSSIG